MLTRLPNATLRLGMYLQFGSTLLKFYKNVQVTEYKGMIEGQQHGTGIKSFDRMHLLPCLTPTVPHSWYRSYLGMSSQLYEPRYCLRSKTVSVRYLVPLYLIWFQRRVAVDQQVDQAGYHWVLLDSVLLSLLSLFLICPQFPILVPLKSWYQKITCGVPLPLDLNRGLVRHPHHPGAVFFFRASSFP